MDKLLIIFKTGRRVKIFVSFYIFPSRDIGKTNTQTDFGGGGFFFNNSRNSCSYSVQCHTQQFSLWGEKNQRNVLSLSVQLIVFFILKVYGCWMEM